MPPTEQIVHMIPEPNGRTPCCGKGPFYLPLNSAMTTKANEVTCPAATCKVCHSGSRETTNLICDECGTDYNLPLERIAAEAAVVVNVAPIRTLRQIVFQHRAVAQASALEITELLAEVQEFIRRGGTVSDG